MVFLAWCLTTAGFILIWSWFGTRKRMKKLGAWEENKTGAYVALVIGVVFLILGFYLF